MASTVWKGQLTFGLVSIPVRIIRAGRQERVQFRKVYRPSRPDDTAESPDDTTEAPEAPSRIQPEMHEGTAERRPVSQGADVASSVAPVRHQYVSQESDQRLSEAEVLRAVEYAKGEFAVFRPEEVKRFRMETSSEMEILQFVDSSAVDPVYLNASYYVLPDKGADKPYALLYAAMQKSGHAAMAYVAMHGRKQLLMLRAGTQGIVMHTVFFENEVHRSDEYHADTKLVTAQEMKLADLLVAQLDAAFDPSQFSDERLERMKAAVAEKSSTSPRKEAPAAPRPVVDIMEALKKSLAARKPAARAADAGAPKAKTRHSRAG